jgi:3-hydroxyisobutyrate dehydrogenase-like beta-hydroxyacid dehydrogenase
MKLLNNFLSATALAATSEAFALGQAIGLDLETMLDVVNVSTGRNSATYDKFPNRVLTGTYDTGFHTRLMAKDVRLFNSVAGETGTLHEVSHAVGSVWNACEDAMPASDFSGSGSTCANRARSGRRQQASRSSVGSGLTSG